jgi:hypothetical protein
MAFNTNRAVIIIISKNKKTMKHTRKNLAQKRDEKRHLQRITEKAKSQNPQTNEKKTMPEPTHHHQAEKTCQEKSDTGSETKMLIDFLTEKYEFRYNQMMGYAEYRSIDGDAWTPVDERELNTMTMEARLKGINIWNSDTRRFVDSRKVPDFNPVTAYLEQVRDCWDGRDHIARLAGTVKTDCRQWKEWFHRWLLAMVAQWTGMNRNYGNSVAPLLISGQGYHKSTFCKSILPAELSWGYMDNLLLTDKRQVMQAMNQMLLVNLDEFNQIPATTQTGFLKNIIQLSTIKMKRPYGKHVEEFPRMASFIATTNMADVLTDPTGNRRFICIEVNEPIDTSTPPCHQQLYAQILHELENGERYWFNMDETQAIMAHNSQYQLKSPFETFFNEHFAITTDEHKGQYMTTAAIYDHIRRHAGSRMSSTSLINFGRTLSNISGIVKRRNKNGSEYLVLRK